MARPQSHRESKVKMNLPTQTLCEIGKTKSEEEIYSEEPRAAPKDAVMQKSFFVQEKAARHRRELLVEMQLFDE